MTDGHYNYKMIFVNINESQKARLEDFFDEIKFYYYTVQKKIESVWDIRMLHTRLLPSRCPPASALHSSLPPLRPSSSS